MTLTSPTTSALPGAASPGSRLRRACRLPLAVLCAGSLIVGLAGPASALAAKGKVGAEIELDHAAACVSTAPAPAKKVKTFSPKTGATSVKRAYAGTVTNPADPADVTTIKTSTEARIKATARKGSLQRMRLEAKVASTVTSALGKASTCRAGAKAEVTVNGKFTLKKRGPVTISWDRAAQGYLAEVIIADESGEENAFFLMLETGKRSVGTARRTMRAGLYEVRLRFLTYAESDMTKPGVTRKRSSNLTFTVAHG